VHGGLHSDRTHCSAMLNPEDIPVVSLLARAKGPSQSSLRSHPLRGDAGSGRSTCAHRAHRGWNRSGLFKHDRVNAAAGKIPVDAFRANKKVYLEACVPGSVQMQHLRLGPACSAYRTRAANMLVSHGHGFREASPSRSERLIMVVFTQIAPTPK
jgi:hypothetical protein